MYMLACIVAPVLCLLLGKCILLCTLVLRHNFVFFIPQRLQKKPVLLHLLRMTRYLRILSAWARKHPYILYPGVVRLL